MGFICKFSWVVLTKVNNTCITGSKLSNRKKETRIWRHCQARNDEGCLLHPTPVRVKKLSSQKQSTALKKFNHMSFCTGHDSEKFLDVENTKHFGKREGMMEVSGLDDAPFPLRPAEGGALWDIFRRHDVPELVECLTKHFREFKHINCELVEKVGHPMHDQIFYLTLDHKRRLKEEFGIEPWTLVQQLGEAIFIPAGCPYQN